MHGKSSKTHVVTFRLDNQTWAKLQAALEAPNSEVFTTSEYCQAVVTRWLWRHDKAATYDPDKKTVERTLQPIRPTKKREAAFAAPLKGFTKAETT